MPGVSTTCCRYNIDEVLNCTWPFHDAIVWKPHKQTQTQPFRVADACFWSGSHDQSVCWGGSSLVSPNVLVPVVAGVSPWCHAVPLWPRLQELCEAPAGWFSPWCTKVTFSLLILSSAKTWQCLAGTGLVLCRSRAPELLGRTSIPPHYTFWRIEVFCWDRKKWEGRTVTWGDTAGVGKGREQPAARDAAAVPEPAEHRDQTSSGNHRHRLLAGKNRWCRSWGRNAESLFEGLCQGGGTKG